MNDATNSPNIAPTILKEEDPEPQLQKLSESASVYFEPILPNPTLVLCGGGHVGCAIGKLAAWCGFNVIAIDDRATFANKERFPDAAKIIVDDPAKVGEGPPLRRGHLYLHRHARVIVTTRSFCGK